MRNEGRNRSRSGGSILAICIIAGVVGGTLVGEPSIGFLGGTGIGLLLLGLLWLKDRHRQV